MFETEDEKEALTTNTKIWIKLCQQSCKLGWNEQSSLEIYQNWLKMKCKLEQLEME